MTHGRTALPPVWLLLAAALAYLNALPASFQFDDFNVIVDNAGVHSLAAWWAGMPGIRPLLKLSYTLNWLADPGPTGFHAVNILLHLINIALVWRLTAHIPAPAGWEHGPALRRARLLATLLFALHPIQTESVTYVSGRSMSLMASFGLSGLICWLESAGRRSRLVWRLAAVVLLTAAMLTKEVAVVLPLTLLLFWRREGGGWPLRLGLFVFVGLALAALFLVLGYQRLLTTPPPRDLIVNLWSEAHAIVYLLGQLLRPFSLDIDPLLPELSGGSLRSGLEMGGLLLALLLAWLARQRQPWLTFAIGWFALLLIPTHTVIPRPDLASERHLYLAGLGLYWLAAVLLTALLPARRLAFALTVMVLSVGGMTCTHLRNRDYRDEIQLWRATVRSSPDNARAWNNLGYAHYLAGQPQAARLAYEEALRLDSGHDKARRNLRALDTPPPASARAR